MKKKLLATGLLWLSFISASATPTVVGKVVNGQQQPLPFVNVVVLNPTDSTFVQGAVTDENGRFHIEVPQEQSYLLKLTSVEYAPLFKQVNGDDAGTLTLTEQVHALKEVVVKANRPQFKPVAGGLSVDIANTLLAQMGTASDVLRQLPRVDVSNDGSVNVFSKGTPEIYINSKKVQNKSELEQLKSTDIKAVEVITSPGARYDATVKSVIRIKTKRSQGEGLSFRADNNVKYNDYLTGFQEDYLKYRHGGWETFMDAYVFSSVYAQDPHIREEINGTNDIVVDQHIRNMSRTWGLYGKWGTSYDFDSDNSVGFSYTLTRNFYDKGHSIGATQDVTKNGNPIGHIDQAYTSNALGGPNHEANAYYLGKLGKVGVDLNLTALWNKNNETKRSEEASSQLTNQTVTTHNLRENHLWAGKLILSYPLWKGSLNVGTELTSTYSHSEYSNDEGVVSNASNEIKERNAAGFTEYQFTFGNFSANAGLRYEHVVSDYYEFGVYQEGPSRRYSDWFPSLSLAWQKGKWGLQGGYVYKTKRPSYGMLSNEVQYDNRYLYEGGNPFLRPEKVQSVSVAGTYSWLSAEIGYEYTKDAMLWTATLYNGQDIGFGRNLNFDNFQYLYASVVASPKFGWYQPSYELYFSRQSFDAKGYGSDRNMNKPNLFLTLRNRFAFPHDFTVHVNFRQSFGEYYGFNHMMPNSNLSIQLIKQFCNKAWTVNLSVNDLLKTNEVKSYTYGNRVNVSKYGYEYSRRVSLTVTYNFNASQSKYKGKGAGKGERGRL